MKILTHLGAFILCVVVFILCGMVGKYYLEIESYFNVMTFGVWSYWLVCFVRWLLIKEPRKEVRIKINRDEIWDKKVFEKKYPGL